MIEKVCVFSRLPHAGMGDLVQRNIFLSLLRDAYPDAELTWLVGRHVTSAPFQEEFVREHSYADDVIVCPDPLDGDAWPDLLDELLDRRFELCLVDAGSAGLGVAQAWQAGIVARVAVPTGAPEDGLITHPMRLRAGCRPDLYDFTVALAGAVGLAPPRPERVVPRLPHRREPPLPAVAERSGAAPLVGVHPGGAPARNRRWPLASYARLCVRLVDELGAALVLLGSTDEATEIGWLRVAVLDARPAARLHVSLGEPLNRTVNLLDGLDLLVGNDSGPAHLAAALSTPTVVIYGPTGTEAVCGRVYPRHRGVSLGYPCQRHLPCPRGCRLGYESIDGPYPRCLTGLAVDRVWTAVRAQLVPGH